MPRLQYTAPSQLGKVIEKVQIVEGLKKKEALRHLIDLANENPDHRMVDFEGEKDVNCTLDLKGKEYKDFTAYRSKYNLVEQNKFFRDALRRGATFYVDKEKANSHEHDIEAKFAPKEEKEDDTAKAAKKGKSI